MNVQSLAEFTGATQQISGELVDGFARRISYLRVSVTDRCDFRCIYCMSDKMIFLPKKDLLTLDELQRLCDIFIAKGVRKIRLTGGEPLVRPNVMSLIRALGGRVSSGRLEELTLTTNGSQLGRFASELAECGIRRINVSLDTLDPEKFRQITRRGDLAKVLAGIELALKAQIEVKVNVVALKGLNEFELPEIMRWAHGLGMAMTVIETMPMGDVEEDRTDRYLPLTIVRRRLEELFTLNDNQRRTGGPARYVSVAETGGTLGFITPMTHNFCESCNRVRVTCNGTLYSCLGQDDAVDLRTILRQTMDDAIVARRIDEGVRRKPRGHNFIISADNRRPAVARHMSVTGG
ncbi:cyclic pyranopterin phosphate synthase [Kaistia soli DSM 19436]|uniref:GTP 3',8-cyclase n=1 Tax=Kaistia soli DSM 19436 TaxID=1122133 RepID=A0A1M5DZQ7_9HYPH|nr:GTP 3',8-cyclase MoaA [Kaistia soli]SHF72449.1 cyclic pyranopterin phosphate synthase [Kaistia soli DSM 19436]